MLQQLVAAGLKCRPNRGRLPALEDSAAHPVLNEAERQLARIISAAAGAAFELRWRPPSPQFQQRVWQALLEIPFGETRSYGQIALRIGQPTAVRAVGGRTGAIRSASSRPAIASSARMAISRGFAGGIEDEALPSRVREGSDERGGRGLKRRARQAFGATLSSAALEVAHGRGRRRATCRGRRAPMRNVLKSGPSPHCSGTPEAVCRPASRNFLPLWMPWSVV